MELYKRIDCLLSHYNLSRSALAKEINIHVNTFGRYFIPDQEDKLRACLWKIHEVFPDISRDWLFFGEGEMFDKAENNPKIAQLQKKVDELEQEVSEERKINRQLTARLLIEGKPEDDIKKTESA